ncbi:MAG TPA: hypothetical protein VK987_02020, partial [Anaerolineae bacterium]|nr:hypothetical protein [Anaerolineae bacterium]
MSSPVARPISGRLLALLQVAILVAAMVVPAMVLAQDDGRPAESPAPGRSAIADAAPTGLPAPAATPRLTAEPDPEPGAGPAVDATREPSPPVEPDDPPDVSIAPTPTDAPAAISPSPAPSGIPAPSPQLEASPSPVPSLVPGIDAISSGDPGSSPTPAAAASRLRDITPAVASLSLSAAADPGSLPEPGGMATVSVSITNTSANAATLTLLEDDVQGDLDGVGDCTTGGGIDAGGVYGCTYQAAFAGPVGSTDVRSVTAQLTDDVDATIATASSPVGVSITDVPSSIVLTKVASPTELDEPGGNVTFTVTVINDSAVDTVELTELTDDVYGDLASQRDCALPQTIPAGGSYACSFSGPVSGVPGDVLTDTVTATATDDDGNPLSGSASADVTILDTPSSMVVTKTASPIRLDEPGGPVTFSITLENTSVVDSITIDSLTDVPFGDITSLAGDCAVPQVVAAGASYSCSFSVDVVGDAGDVLTDTVTAAATDDDGNPLSESDVASVAIDDVLPTIEVTKSASPSQIAEPGGDITFTVAVANTSPEPITVTSIRDDVYGDLGAACGVPFVIAVGGSATCDFVRAVLGDAGNDRTNVITVIAQDDEGNVTSERDEATVSITDVLPTIALQKTITPTELPEPGGTAQVRVAVTNTSVENVVVTQL